MNVFKIMKLSPKEIKLLKKFFVISLSVCVITVVAAWFIQHASLKSDGGSNQISGTSKINNAMFSQNNEELQPIDLEAHRIAAEEYKTLIPEKTIPHLQRILHVEKKNRKIKLDLATAYLKSGKYKEAEALFVALIDEELQDSLSTAIIARYGLTLFFIGKIDESIAQLEKTITQFPEAAEAYCYLGQVKASLNRASDSARHYLEKALAVDPGYVEAYYQLARYYMNKPLPDSSDYYKARSNLLHCIEREPLNSKAHSRLGMVYFYLRQPYLAEKSYITSLAFNPNDYNTHYNLGECYYTLFQDRTKALEEFKKTVQLKSNHVEANFKIGLISLESDLNKEAVTYFNKALEDAPNNVRIMLQLAVAYEKLGMKEDAIRVYKSILTYDELNDIALQKIKLLGK